MEPNRNTIVDDLEFTVSNWSNLDEPACLEVRCLKPDNKTLLCKFTRERLDEALRFVMDANLSGYNIYVTRNPVRIETNRSATDDDIIATTMCWADCDEGQAFNKIANYAGTKPDLLVVTGTKPQPRGHFYWLLDEVSTDLNEWRRTMENIARKFGSDTSVVNPARIMRLAGTVSYPNPKKQQKGYEVELTKRQVEL